MRLIGVYDYTVILTYLSLFSAVFGIHSAMQGNFGAAFNCLFISGICDAFDGMVARTKKDRTEDEKNFGIQLDSLCGVLWLFPGIFMLPYGSSRDGRYSCYIYVLLMCGDPPCIF